MDESKRSLDELLEGMGIGEEAESVKPVLEERDPVEEDGDQLDPLQVVEQFMVGLLLYLDPAYSIETRVSDERIYVEIVGGDLSKVIGKEGRTLRAIEYLVNSVLAKHTGGTVRASVDAAGYRRRQEERITRLAQQMSDHVIANGEAQALPPMRPSERRIVHLALQNHPLVTTSSYGEGAERHVVILPKGLKEQDDGE